MLSAYVDETISELDLLAQSHRFQKMGACHDWQLAHRETLIGTYNLHISVEFNLAKFQESIMRDFIALHGKR